MRHSPEQAGCPLPVIFCLSLLTLTHPLTCPYHHPPHHGQTSIPKGPVSGHVPSPLEAHPSMWLVLTEEGTDIVQQNA